MKQDLHTQTDAMDEEETVDTMTTDIVEDFARQLDQIVRIQDEQSDDEEEVDQEEFGYQQLPQDEDEDDMYQQLQSDDEEEEQVEQMKDPLELPLDNSARLNPETSDLIKSIMTNIQLSNDSIPDWAKKIPESAWLPRVNK